MVNHLVKYYSERLGFCMQIAYTSQNFILKQRGHIRRSFSLFALVPECILPILGRERGTMGRGDGDSSTPWTKGTITRCYLILNTRSVGFILSGDLNFTRNCAFS